MSPGSFNCSRFRDRVTAAGQPLILGAMTAYSALIGSGILAAFVDFRVHSGRSVSDWAIMAWSHRGTVALRLARARTARPGPPTGGPVRSDFFGTRDPPTLALPESVIGRRHGVPRRRPGTRDAGDRRRCGPAPGLLPSAATERNPPGGDRRGSCPSDGARAALVAGPPGGDQRRGSLVLARALCAPLAPAGAVSWRRHPLPAARTSHFGVILISGLAGPLPHCAHDQNAGNALGSVSRAVTPIKQLSRVTRV